jgi:hypothetical protein
VAQLTRVRFEATGDTEQEVEDRLRAAVSDLRAREVTDRWEYEVIDETEEVAVIRSTAGFWGRTTVHRVRT